MLYRAAADGVVIIHVLFVLFVILGGLLVFRDRRWTYYHLPAALWGAFVELAGRQCPLTPLEGWLRRQGNLPSYQESFIEHYLLPILYPPGLTHAVQVLLGLVVVAVNAIIYWLAWRRTGETKRHPGGA